MPELDRLARALLDDPLATWSGLDADQRAFARVKWPQEFAHERAAARRPGIAPAPRAQPDAAASSSKPVRVAASAPQYGVTFAELKLVLEPLTREIRDRIAAVERTVHELDFDLELRDERVIRATLRIGGREIVREVVAAWPLYVGVHEAGRTYRRGDVVSHGGSTFIAQCDTTAPIG